MISIIICSRKSNISNELRNNIDETIGVPHEIIVINNSENQYSLSSAYNCGVKLSKYPILCFMHDDISYHSINWGENVVQHFKDPSVGMIGVSGSRYLSRIPSIWWAGGLTLLNDSNGTICQNSIDTNPACLSERRYNTINPTMAQESDVVILDGLWFCIRKKLFDSISFDTNTFDGFHFYDLDISLQVKQRCKKLLVVYDITIEHISKSRHDNKWVESCFKFYKKWKQILPLSTVKYDDTRLLATIEYDNMRVMLNILKGNGCLFKGILYLLTTHFLPLMKIAISDNWPLLYSKNKLLKCK